jgi:hypothetical protein
MYYAGRQDDLKERFCSLDKVRDASSMATTLGAG